MIIESNQMGFAFLGMLEDMDGMRSSSHFNDLIFVVMLIQVRNETIEFNQNYQSICGIFGDL